MILDNSKLQRYVHCDYIWGKISKDIAIIIKTRKVFDEATLWSLYNILILPYVNYCIHVFGKAYDIHLEILLQNKALIDGVPPCTSIDNFYLELDILPVKISLFTLLVCSCKIYENGWKCHFAQCSILIDQSLPILHVACNHLSNSSTFTLKIRGRCIALVCSFIPQSSWLTLISTTNATISVQWPLLLTWINFNPRMNKQLHPILSAKWNFLFILKLQLCRWS